ncbi:MAG: transglycosylase domain-containing protein, partial [Caldilineaceae bacterium]|nr:transglycosylase domain-containing protein [Caldilineaceae bacterium]
LAYGPEAAAQVYFGKSAADLTLAEASLLAGLPQQPANLNPFVNFDAARARQDVVLQLMVRHGYLSEAEAEAVRGEQETLRAYFAVASVNAGQRAEIRAPHFAQYVIDTLDEQLGAGYTARSGLRIFTTLDLDMQELAQRTVTEKVAELSPRYGFNNSALVAMKPGTAEILAMVGSADFANDQIAGQVNVAVRPRQPGSSIKPIFYAAALDANVISPATVIWDLYARYVIDKRQVYIPRNYDEKYHGPVTVRSALANSYNVPMVKLFYAAGPEQMASRAYAMGIRTFTSDKVWYGLGLSLGAGEVTLLDLTNAYTTLASEGRHNPPRAVLTVLDGRGESIELVHNSDPDPVISPQAAFLVTNILSDNEARAPMFGLNSRLHLSFPAAAKT